MKKTILIADDEKRITSLISDFLGSAGFDTLIAHDGLCALKIFEENPTVSLCIFDIMMPQLDGWELTKKIREKSDVPIIILSARSEDFDLLEGFDSGADEYVTKPFSPAVLVKRVQALIKRYEGEIVSESAPKGLYINRDAYTATLDGQLLDLTLKEFNLLMILEDNVGRVLTREQLLDNVWGYDFYGDTRTVDSHIARLRTKLGDWGIAHLKTVYGMGYKLDV